MILHCYESPNKLDLGDLGVHTVTYTVSILKDRWHETTSVSLLKAIVSVWHGKHVFDVDLSPILRESAQLVREIEDEVHKDFEMQCLICHEDVGS